LEQLIESLKDNVPRRLTIDRDMAPPNLAEGDAIRRQATSSCGSVQYRNEEPYSVVNLHLSARGVSISIRAVHGAAALVTIDAMDEITLLEAHQTLTIAVPNLRSPILLKISIGAPTVEAHCVVID